MSDAVEPCSFVPAMAPAGDQISCESQLTNRSDATIAVSL